MKITIGSENDLTRYIDRQLSTLFGVEESVGEYIPEALGRAEYCFQHTNNKYYFENGEVMFSPHNSVQNSIFLYILGKCASDAKANSVICDSLYYLNKTLNSVDWYYQIDLPPIFGCEHPIGCILGRAKYGNRLFVYQCVTVGGNKGKYPIIGENVALFSNSKVIGDSVIGDNVAVSANTYIKDQNVPDNCIVFGESPNLIIKDRSEDEMKGILSEFF